MNHNLKKLLACAGLSAGTILAIKGVSAIFAESLSRKIATCERENAIFAENLSRDLRRMVACIDRKNNRNTAMHENEDDIASDHIKVVGCSGCDGCDGCAGCGDPDDEGEGEDEDEETVVVLRSNGLYCKERWGSSSDEGPDTAIACFEYFPENCENCRKCDQAADCELHDFVLRHAPSESSGRPTVMTVEEMNTFLHKICGEDAKANKEAVCSVLKAQGYDPDWVDTTFAKAFDNKNDTKTETAEE